MLADSDYRAPGWLKGGDAQTIYPAVFLRKPEVTYRREYWATPDGDEVAVDFAVPEPQDQSAPVLIHFHGLEGSSGSHYARALMAECARRGVRGLVVHYRGCGGRANRLPRAYFAADAAELDWIFHKAKTLWPDAPRYAMGVSLGANNLIWWAGSRAEAALSLVDAVVAVCCPWDLYRSSLCLSKGIRRLYQENFLHTLRDKALKKAERFPDVLDRDAIAACRTILDFDDCVTAPLHGYRDGRDYWEKCSSKSMVGGIKVPALIVNSCNDPFVRPDFFPKISQFSASCRLEFPKEGGHCGFLLGAFPGNLGYLPMRTLGFCLEGR